MVPEVQRWGRKTLIWVINGNLITVEISTTTRVFYVLCQREYWVVCIAILYSWDSGPSMPSLQLSQLLKLSLLHEVSSSLQEWLFSHPSHLNTDAKGCCLLIFYPMNLPILIFHPKMIWLDYSVIYWIYIHIIYLTDGSIISAY